MSRQRTRPTRRDWIAGLGAGAVLGGFVLGVGGRAGMRVIALAIGQQQIFTIGGSITVVLLGAASGALIGAIFLLARLISPGRRWLRILLFWCTWGAVVLRGLHPVGVLNLSVFGPLFVLHASLLHVYWCRVRAPSVVGSNRNMSAA